MIVHHEKRWLVITPPHTGSTTLNRLLTTPRFGGSLYLEWHQHNDAIPVWLAGFRVYLSVRNPFARASGLYRWTARDLYYPHPIGTFTEFARRVLLGQDGPDLYYRRLVDFALGVELAGVLRLEHWGEDLQQLKPCGPYVIPHENSDPALEHWTERYGREPEAVPLVREWAAADCERFGYHGADTNSACTHPVSPRSGPSITSTCLEKILA